MSIKISSIYIKGTDNLGENFLPKFKSMPRNKPVFQDDTFPKDKLKGFGYETNDIILPYTYQDKYCRANSNITLKTIVFQNDFLIATFLPQYGGRLISLFDKTKNRELLFKNSVFQPANLAIRNAWFSGGIEWNIGHVGHTFLTCSPMYFAICKDKDGNDFLRMYEYERCKRIFFQIDFHLPNESKVLIANIKIINDMKTPTPVFYWTNIAVPETKKTRVFSSADDVIHVVPTHGNDTVNFTYCKMPFIPEMEQKDCSYPTNYTFAGEYFFQTDKSVKSPWQAASYEDGITFFERSTDLLKYRKLFCWGTHNGGQNWKDHLSEEDKGAYIELQAGPVPTQFHTSDVPPNTVWSFTQIFGGAETPKYDGDWYTARDKVGKSIDNVVNEVEMLKLHTKYDKMSKLPLHEIISMGSGWGALERKRREKFNENPVPSQLIFPYCAIGEREIPWLNLLEEEIMPESLETPKSWMVDKNWLPVLEKALKNSENGAISTHLGIMAYENGEYEKGKTFFNNAVKICPCAINYRNLAYINEIENDYVSALSNYKNAFELSNGQRTYACEYLNLLNKMEKYSKVYDIFLTLKQDSLEDERIILLAATSAFEIGNYNFVEEVLCRQFATIRERDNTYNDLYVKFHGKLAADREGKSFNENKEYYIKNVKLPKNLDFRMFY